MFPIGALLGILGASVWPLTAWAGLPYPGPLHASLMIEGFELAFVSGFLLTVAPRMTRTDLADRRELPWVAGGVLGFATLAFVGRTSAAHLLAAFTIMLLGAAVIRRFAKRANDPPEEMLFVPAALLMGLTGALLQFAVAALPAFEEPSPRLGVRLMSLGMVLALVIGVGSLLVPVFLEIKDPLVIPKIAKPHERPARRALYASLALGLMLSFVADALGHPAVGAFARASIVTFVLAFLWKLWRLPGRRTVPAFVMWTSGWLIGIGLWAAALWPIHGIAALHVTLLGGYGALTMGIASRVVVTHGGRGPDAEARVLTPLRAGLLVVALGLRVGAENAGAAGPTWLAASALAWIVAWGGWLLAARGPRSPRAAPTPTK